MNDFQFGEINIVCTDIDKSLKFYTDVLQFKLSSENDGAIQLVGVGQKFLLVPIAFKKVTDEPYCSKAQISFDLYVKDIKKAYNYFKEKNVKFEKDLTEGKDHFFIRDPDGLVIEIME